MITKTIPLKFIIIPDIYMLVILDILKEQIDGFKYEFDIDNLILNIPEEHIQKYNKIINTIYDDAYRDFINPKLNNEYRILNAKIITFIDRLYAKNKQKA